MKKRSAQQSKKNDFQRIAGALAYIQAHFREQPTLAKVAASVGLSPAHFQRVFTAWAGLSPKKFLQYISLEHAKKLLKESQATLFQAAHRTGLSGSSRLHDLFVTMEGMTPAEYQGGGRNLRIRYQFVRSIFGEMLIASTTRGICYLVYSSDRDAALHSLHQTFPQAVYQNKSDRRQRQCLSFLRGKERSPGPVRLHLKGTPFQLKVWKALLEIPEGSVAAYGHIARAVAAPQASRAVGSAIGRNPIAFLIPCHRVIQASGLLGGYHWGKGHKAALLGWEGARAQARKNTEPGLGNSLSVE